MCMKWLSWLNKGVSSERTISISQICIHHNNINSGFAFDHSSLRKRFNHWFAFAISDPWDHGYFLHENYFPKLAKHPNLAPQPFRDIRTLWKCEWPTQTLQFNLSQKYFQHFSILNLIFQRYFGTQSWCRNFQQENYTELKFLTTKCFSSINFGICLTVFN